MNRSLAEVPYRLQRLTALRDRLARTDTLRQYADDVLEHYARNRDLGWSEAEAFQRAVTRATLKLPMNPEEVF